MEVIYAYLANYVEFSPDGKLTMIGGDFESITCVEFPSPPFNLALALRLTFSAAELQRPYQLRVEIVGAEITQPDGTRIQPTMDASLNMPPIPGGLTMARANIAAQFFAVTFPREAEYPVRILIDGQERKTIPLRLVRQPAAAGGA